MQFALHMKFKTQGTGSEMRSLTSSFSLFFSSKYNKSYFKCYIKFTSKIAPCLNYVLFFQTSKLLYATSNWKAEVTYITSSPVFEIALGPLPFNLKYNSTA